MTMPLRPRLHSLEDGPFWDSVAAHALALQRCSACAHVRYPPGPRCPRCLSAEADWVPVRGDAVLVSWTTFQREYLAAWPPPHTVAVGRLAEGPLLAASVGPEHVAALATGAPLRLAYTTHTDGYEIPCYATT